MTSQHHILVLYSALCNDGDQPVNAPPQWAIATAEDDVWFICGQHKWRSTCLVLNDGTAIFTAANTAQLGHLFVTPGKLLCVWLCTSTSLDNPRTGKPEGSSGNLLWQGDKVAAKRGNFDVLLRKRA